METTRSHQQRSGRRDAASSDGRAESTEITPEELTEILQEASRIQTSGGNRRLTSMDEAYEAARELGIAEENVSAAAENLRRRKARQTRTRARTTRRRNEFLRFLGLTAAIVFAVVFFRGLGTARLVLFGMSIPLLILGFQWIAAELKGRSPESDSGSPSPGACRVCGERAWSEKATFCFAHRPDA